MISLNLRHPLGKATTLLFFLFSAILWTSCDEKEKPLSSENLIVRLSLKDGDKEYAAKVSSGTLSVELPSGSTLPTEVTISVLDFSLKASASTSANSKLTLAAGRATITVTAENKATKEYTLIVTVKKNATADLKSLIVSIGSKNYTATLSSSQASVLLPASVAIPAFVTVASFEVSGQARASVAVGGRVDLTDGTGSIVVTAEDGTTTRSYTLEVSKEEANQANLFALSIRFGQTVYEAVIAGDVATFSEVSRFTSNGVIAVINISEGARSSVAVDGALSFTDGEGQFIVTASDGQTRKTITVKLEGETPSTEAELSALSLTIGGVTYVATISGTVATVLTPQVVTSASVASLSYTTGATSSVEQGSPLTFTGGASAITIMAADGETTKAYQVVLVKDGDFLASFSFQVADNSYTSPYTAFATSLGRIDQTAGTVEVELSPYLRGVDLASLVPSFTTIGGATVVVGTATQESGATPNNFNGNVVTYTVSLAGTRREYMVRVELSNLAWIPDANFRAKLKDALPQAAFSRNDSLITDHSSVTALSEMSVESSSIRSMIGLEFFTGLTALDCYDNQMTSLDVTKNITLTTLYCYSNDLRNLDVSKNIALTLLSCHSNQQLTALDVTKNIALSGLYCNSNNLTDLDVSQNTALTILDCATNDLTALDVSQNTALTQFRCNNNRLTALDVSRNIELTTLSCDSNPLTSLDVSQNTALRNFYCISNQLTSLDVSRNTALRDFYCTSNQLTSLDVSRNTELRNLECNKNQLTSLDVSRNIELTNLACNNNQLTSLDVTKNIGLVQLYCSSNQLTSLDVRVQQLWSTLSINAGKIVKGVVKNPLTTLYVHEDVKDHAEVIEAKTNRGDALTISTYSTAGNVICKDYNPITTTCTYPLISFSIEFASNNLVTSHAGMTSLVGEINHEAQTITVRIPPYRNNINQTILSSLKASFEVKSSTTVTVGGVTQTSDVTPNDFSTPVTYSVTSGGTTKTYEVSVKTTNLAWIPDDNFRANLKRIQSLAGAFTQNDSLITDHSSVTGLTEVRVESADIGSMAGLEFFTGLTNLNCSSNQLTSLDVSQNIALTTLNCGNNQLTSLDVTQKTGLTNLECEYNRLTSLDLTKNIGLTNIACNNNQLTSLDLTKNIALINLYCRNNQLRVLDVSKNTVLITLNCSSNQLTSLDLTRNTALVYFSCSSNQLTSLDLRAQQAWTALRIDAGETADGVVKNPLTTLLLHEDVKDHAEVIEAKTNRVNALTISTYSATGGTACNNYDPRQSSRGCKG